MPTYDDLAKMKADYHSALEAGAKEAIRDRFASLFAAYPDVEGVRWTQYTPYFNDGEPCVFSVNSPDILLVGGDPDEEDEEGGWYYCHGGYGDRHPAYEMAQIDDDIARCLGDHVQVTIRRDMTMTIGEYDHD